MGGKSKNGLNLGVTANITPGTASNLPSKPLLPTVGSGQNRKLARTFQKLVGVAKDTDTTLSPYALNFLATLNALGFEIDLSKNIVNHIIFERQLDLPVLTTLSGNQPEAAALQFAVKKLPELEFFLPYISLQSILAAKTKTLQQNLQTALAPEPDYDDDGFLTE